MPTATSFIWHHECYLVRTFRLVLIKYDYYNDYKYSYIATRVDACHTETMDECGEPAIPYLNTVQVAFQFRLGRRLGEGREPKYREPAEHRLYALPPRLANPSRLLLLQLLNALQNDSIDTTSSYIIHRSPFYNKRSNIINKLAWS